MANEIKPGVVPKEVIAAFREALKRDDTSFEADFCAALSAWPGMHHYEPNAEPYYGKHIILPITEKA